MVSLVDATLYCYPGSYFLHVAYNPDPTCPSTGCSRGRYILEPITGVNADRVHCKLSRNTRSVETLSSAKDWITECMTHHEQCKPPLREKGWCPTRLLYFDLRDSSDKSVRLVENRDMAQNEEYTTLTHRWGSGNHLTLNNHTLYQLLRGVSLNFLPQLFQDAISISSDLGVRYMWIDSLCILQDEDNISDWHREAPRMQQVYSNSFCNISAADAKDESESIFNLRDRYTAPTPPVVELTLLSQGGTVDTKSFLLSDHDFWESEVSSALVNTRAWAFQERLLAPRVLHFGKQQLFWECFKEDAAELYPHGLPPTLSSFPTGRFKTLDPDEYLDRAIPFWMRDLDPNAAAHLIWYRIVGAYTARKLTFPGDKLVACSGIAKRMAEIVQDSYVAGMWRRYLEGELLWMVTDAGSAISSRPNEYRAPTWSWASIEGQISPGEPHIEHSLITVEGLSLDYWTSDTTNSIRNGWLCLRGTLKKTKLVRNKSTTGRHYWDMFLDDNKVTVLEDTSAMNYQPRIMLDVLQEDFEEENSKRFVILHAC